MKHIDSRELKFVTESKSNRLLDDNGRKQVRDYLADRKNEFEEVETGTEYRFVHEMKSEVKGGLVVKFVFLKQRFGDKALVLMTNALDMSVQDVVKNYKRRWDIEVYYRDCPDAREWASTRSGRSTFEFNSLWSTWPIHS